MNICAGSPSRGSVLLRRLSGWKYEGGISICSWKTCNACDTMCFRANACCAWIFLVYSTNGRIKVSVKMGYCVGGSHSSLIVGHWRLFSQKECIKYLAFVVKFVIDSPYTHKLTCCSAVEQERAWSMCEQIQPVNGTEAVWIIKELTIGKCHLEKHLNTHIHRTYAQLSSVCGHTSRC